MSKVPADLKYTEDNDWLRTESNGQITIGITDYMQQTMGELIYAELPRVGQKVALSEEVCVVESVKAATGIYSPVAGEVVAVNDDVQDEPDQVNEDAYDAWIYKVKPASPLSTVKLLSAAEYKKLIGEN